MRNRPENQIEIRLTLIRHGATLSNKEGRYLGKRMNIEPGRNRNAEKSCDGRKLSDC